MARHFYYNDVNKFGPRRIVKVSVKYIVKNDTDIEK